MTASSLSGPELTAGGVGDRVWSKNHLPWLINRIGPMYGDPTSTMIWAFMDYDPSYAVQADLGATLFMAEPDFPMYIYKSHPSDTPCRQAGCQYCPWGAR
ncbi:hypothetical protein [Kitasatospora kazusensis]|uniref:hypothetical protein n=1 Tax=Kitasatospora kazusensis TaxID=407974 RepID=UPI0031D3BC67